MLWSGPYMTQANQSFFHPLDYIPHYEFQNAPATEKENEDNEKQNKGRGKDGQEPWQNDLRQDHARAEQGHDKQYDENRPAFRLEPRGCGPAQVEGGHAEQQPENQDIDRK